MRKIWWTQTPNRRISVENTWGKNIYCFRARKTPLIFLNLGAMRFEKMKKTLSTSKGPLVPGQPSRISARVFQHQSRRRTLHVNVSINKECLPLIMYRGGVSSSGASDSCGRCDKNDRSRSRI